MSMSNEHKEHIMERAMKKGSLTVIPIKWEEKVRFLPMEYIVVRVTKHMEFIPIIDDDGWFEASRELTTSVDSEIFVISGPNIFDFDGLMLHKDANPQIYIGNFYLKVNPRTWEVMDRGDIYATVEDNFSKEKILWLED